MGQKVNPISNRLPLVRQWQSHWFASGKNYTKQLSEDLQIRRFLEKRLRNMGLAKIKISRSREKIDVSVTTSRPGLIIGRQGQGINQLRDDLQKVINPSGIPAVKLDIIEERKPDLSAALVAENIGSQIERRIPYRRACKSAIERVLSSGAKGVRIIISGRLGGAEIARRDKFQEGAIPLSRLQSNIDFGIYHAKTTYGVIGVKVWLNLGSLADTLVEKE